MSETWTTFTVAPKSDDPVIVEVGKCFLSIDGRHIYRQETNYVLHINLDREQEGGFLINTLHDNHLTEYLRDNWLKEMLPELFQIMLDKVKSLIP